MTSTATSLYDLAAELLDKSVDVLDQTAAQAPQFRYVSHGPPAYDCCDTVTVHAGLIGYAALARGPGGSPPDPRMSVVPEVGLTVTALRCMSAQPSGGLQINLPSIVQIDADAQAVFADGWTLFNGLNRAYRDGLLFEGFPCRVASIEPAVPIAPEGGCLGWSVLVLVQLDGFGP